MCPIFGASPPLPLGERPGEGGGPRVDLEKDPIFLSIPSVSHLNESLKDSRNHYTTNNPFPTAIAVTLLLSKGKGRGWGIEVLNQLHTPQLLIILDRR